jgi:ATP-dependent Lon protease
MNEHDDTPDLEELVGTDRMVLVLPLRNAVLFPRNVVPIRVGRATTKAVVEGALASNRVVLAIKQKDGDAEAPSISDLEPVGCLATILRMATLPDGTLSVLLHGQRRARVVRSEAAQGLRVEVAALEELVEPGPRSEALLRTARDQLERLRGLVPELPVEITQLARQIGRPGMLADVMASFTSLEPDEAQGLLETADSAERLRRMIEYLERDLHVIAVGREIREEAQASLEERHTEAVLREQLAAIQRKLGEGESGRSGLSQLRTDLQALQLPEEARQEVDRELQRLESIPPASPEHAVIRGYLETMAELPWTRATEDRLDLVHAECVLDEDHYGLSDIKERILEFLAVRRFQPDAPAPIFCFVGPPGTGKTSLGRSIARAMGRSYVRQSLGGIHDEAEIRGHRRTYVGAMPGRLISALRKAGTRNPVIVLDEIDKVGRDVRGDPYAALLEVLDPEQNNSFVDHYLGTPFDLSRVLFICTANTLDGIPGPLRDRLEVVQLPGYTPEEKREIARRHILPRKLESMGLQREGLEVTEDALDLLIDGYTREAGVRELERQIATLLRKQARHLTENAQPIRRLEAARVRQLLRHPRFLEPEIPPMDRPGVALGLAWTPVGGEVLVIEAVSGPGEEKLVLTGQLGDVMKESATAALSYLRANAHVIGSDGPLRDSRIHLHVPAGAISKDGPSAGVAMFVALASLSAGWVPRDGVAMTGEITLRGRVLEVGGIKQKVLGAHRAGIRTVILPRRNQHDLDDVPEEIRNVMRFVPIDEAAEALPVALRVAPTRRHRRVG